LAETSEISNLTDTISSGCKLFGIKAVKEEGKLEGKSLLEALQAGAPANKLFRGARYPNEIKGINEGTTTGKFKIAGGETTCQKVKFTSELQTEPLESIAIAPVYEMCTSGGETVTIDANGCKWEPNANSGSVSIGPSPCGPIELKYSRGCEVTISNQLNRNAAVYNNVMGGTLKVNMMLTSIGYNTNAVCVTTGPQTNGIYESAVLLEGFSGMGAAMRRNTLEVK
jgi:hypothetical protein